MMTRVPLSLPLGAAQQRRRAARADPALAHRPAAARCARSTSTLLGTAALAVLLATVLSYAVARTITRPLGAITGAMREVAATGDLTRKIALRGPAGGTTRTRGCSPRRSTR